MEQVVVVGAGPVGLWLAAELRLGGRYSFAPTAMLPALVATTFSPVRYTASAQVNPAATIHRHELVTLRCSTGSQRIDEEPNLSHLRALHPDLLTLPAWARGQSSIVGDHAHDGSEET